MGSWILKSLLLQLLFMLIQHAALIVRYLPGFKGPLPFELETGVSEAEEEQLFYYFIRYESNPKEDPLLVWLTGGRGCSSFSGLVYENVDCGGKYVNVNPLNIECLKLVEEFMKCVSRIYDELVLDTNCDITSPDCYNADSGSTVRYLPGFQGPLPFELETGYIGVGEADEEQLFYYFIKSERNPEEDPLLIWLSGGPGCSSLSGLLFENGPMTFKIESYDGDIPSLVSTTYSWTKVANIIYLDSPVGTGFSYSRNRLAAIPSDTRSAKRVHEFVHNWLAKHPEYLSNPFYVTGNSYSGKVVPAIVQEISNGNGLCCKPYINLQGYVLGNPVTNFDHNDNWRIPYAHGMALISDEIYEALKRSCRGNYIKVDPLNTKCLKSVQEFEHCVSGLDVTYILGPKYVNASDPYVSNPSEHRMSVQSNCWADDKSVRIALHVEKGTIGEWLRCYREIPYKFDISSTVPYHKNNSIQGYRSLIFSGDHDMDVPFLATQDWIKSLNYSIIDDWRPWVIHNQVAGYTRTYANKMTFATVKGGGHTMVYKPEDYSFMFERWINGQPL